MKQFLTWLRKSSKANLSPRRPSSVRPGLVQLEERQLLSITDMTQLAQCQSHLVTAEDSGEVVTRIHSKGKQMLRNITLLGVFVLGFFGMTLQAQSQWQDADLTAITGGSNVQYGIAMVFDPLW